MSRGGLYGLTNDKMKDMANDSRMRREENKANESRNTAIVLGRFRERFRL